MAGNPPPEFIGACVELMMPPRVVEDPVRIKGFLESIQRLDWKDPAVSLDALCQQAFELLRFEVDYYYRIRQTKRRLSLVFRVAVLIFGSLGMLAPLAEAAKLHDGVGGMGYLFLAVAGVFLAANSLFAGTSGHGRIVTTQLSLEKVIAVGSVQWNELRSRRGAAPDKAAVEKEMFDFIVKLLETGYQLILDETADWAKSLNESIANYETGIKQ
jgi:hypothetical protein